MRLTVVPARRQVASTALAIAALAAMLAAAPVPAPAQGPTSGDQPAASPGPLCLLTLDELSELTGLRFTTIASGPDNCTYDGDPAAEPVTVDLRIEPVDPDDQSTGGDPLWWTRFDYAAGGLDTTVAGHPAWEADLGLWVALDGRVLVVQPILFFMADPPPAQAFLVPVAELALSRLGAADGT